MGAQGSSNAAVIRTNNSILDFSQTVANPSVWKFSTINFNSLAATFANISQLEFSGHATPFQNTTAAITNSSSTACTWLFSGSVAQTITSANRGVMAGAATRVWSSSTAAASFNITNTEGTTGLSVQGNLTGTSSLTGSLTLAANSILTLDGSATELINAASISLDPISTVRYARNNVQTITAATYGHKF